MRKKTVILLQNETKKKAEVAAYFKRFEEAERLYLEMDRRYYLVVVVFFFMFCLNAKHNGSKMCNITKLNEICWWL